VTGPIALGNNKNHDADHVWFRFLAVEGIILSGYERRD
jgi:hypothetical protein